MKNYDIIVSLLKAAGSVVGFATGTYSKHKLSWFTKSYQIGLLLWICKINLLGKHCSSTSWYSSHVLCWLLSHPLIWDTLCKIFSGLIVFFGLRNRNILEKLENSGFCFELSNLNIPLETKCTFLVQK